MKSCDSCRTRRAFLEDLATMPVLVATALGLTSRVEGWSVRPGVPLSASGDERTYPLPASDGVTIDRDTQVIIARSGGAVYAFNLACPHENTALRWRQTDGRFQCPRHDSKYRPDGAFYEGRATRNMDRFAIRREGATIVIHLERLFRSDTNKGEWEAALVRA